MSGDGRVAAVTAAYEVARSGCVVVAVTTVPGVGHLVEFEDDDATSVLAAADGQVLLGYRVSAGAMVEHFVAGHRTTPQGRSVAGGCERCAGKDDAGQFAHRLYVEPVPDDAPEGAAAQ
jgi:hypothetical protein